MNPPGISIVSSTPLWMDWSSSWELTRQIHKYQHIIEALGGYWSAQFTIRGGRNLMDDWLQDGLGRHVQVFDHSLTCIWEGFVDKVTANYGPLSVVRGPLMDMANTVRCVYSAIEYDEDDNPIVGTRTSTVVAEDTDSQDLWGVHHKVLSIGGAHENEAEQIRDTYLEQNKEPRTSKEWRADTEAETSVTVDCLGYVHFLMGWAYLYGTAGTQDADTKLHNIFIREPNIAWLIFNEDNVDANTLQVPSLEQDDNMAWSVIKDIVARGDAGYNRWLFGIYTDCNAYYHQAPSTIEYQQRLSQPRPVIERAGGDEIYPWNVLPGQWLMFPDFLIGQAMELDLRDDPRAMFIEQVKYTAPWELQLRGGSTDTLDAVVAQFGLSGIGA